MYEHKYIFGNLFWHLLEVLIVQFEVTFGKYIEIHLNDRKFEISSKTFETHPRQHICSLLLTKKFGSMEDIFPRVASQQSFSVYLRNKMTKKTSIKSSKNAINW